MPQRNGTPASPQRYRHVAATVSVRHRETTLPQRNGVRTSPQRSPASPRRQQVQTPALNSVAVTYRSVPFEHFSAYHDCGLQKSPQLSFSKHSISS